MESLLESSVVLPEPQDNGLLPRENTAHKKEQIQELKEDLEKFCYHAPTRFHCWRSIYATFWRADFFVAGSGIVGPASVRTVDTRSAGI